MEGAEGSNDGKRARGRLLWTSKDLVMPYVPGVWDAALQFL
jgi:hypothetical protein